VDLLKPSKTKMLLAAALTPFFFVLALIYLTPVCIDPSAEAWALNPDPEYWGCHTMLHRIYRFVPDFIAVHALPSVLLLSLALAYLASAFVLSAAVWLKRILARG
jgi:hypothetical protein